MSDAINVNLTDTDRDHLLILDIRLYVFAGVLLPMAIIGLILNSFTILVLLHPRMRNSTNMYLTALSLANIICLINFIFLYSFRYLFSYKTFQNAVYYGSNEINMYESFINQILRFCSPIFSTFQLYAIYLTCAVTVDRFIYLRWPLKADSICTIKATFKVICIIFFFCLTYNFPRWFEVEADLIKTSQNVTYYQARGTEFGRNEWYRLIYQRYCYLIFVYGLPFCVLLIVNIGIIKKLIEMAKRKSNLLGKKHGQNGKKKPTPLQNKDKKCRGSYNSTHLIDPKITFMVLAVVVAFFFCQFPYLILHLLSSYGNRKIFQVAKAICDFLAALNCCINFLIYCFFGTNFRNIATFMLLNPSCDIYNKLKFQKYIDRKANEICSKKKIDQKNSNNVKSYNRKLANSNENSLDKSKSFSSHIEKETEVLIASKVTAANLASCKKETAI